MKPKNRLPLIIVIAKLSLLLAACESQPPIEAKPVQASPSVLDNDSVADTASTPPQQPTEKTSDEEQVIRIWLDRKHRRGKTATLVKGYDGTQNQLTAIAKTLKKLCGVGGTVKDGDIILQGDQREKVLKYLVKEGFKDVKLAGG